MSVYYNKLQARLLSCFYLIKFRSSPWSSECLHELKGTLVTAETSACRRGLSRALPSGLLLLIHRIMSLKTSSILSSGSPDVNPCHIPGYNLNSLSTLAAVKKSSRLISGSVTRSSSPWSSRKGIVTCMPPNSHDFDNQYKSKWNMAVRYVYSNAMYGGPSFQPKCFS